MVSSGSNNANSPAKIFKDVNDRGIHITRKYGENYGKKKNGTWDPNDPKNGIKYNMYKAATGDDKTFSICAPVKLKKALLSETSGPNKSDDFAMESNDSPFYTFEENVGVFKEGWYIQFWGITDAPWESSPNNEKWRDKNEIIGTTTSNYVKIAIFQPLGSERGKRLLSTVDPTPFIEFSVGDVDENGDAIDLNSAATGTPDATDGGTGFDIGSVAKAAAFSTFFSMPGIFDTLESNSLTGQRSLMNDQPLMPFIEQLCMACLRQFMSTPSGDFFAFYPDYFGGLGKTAYWLIDDIEIINGSIELSDDQLATHVYVVGDIVGPPSAAMSGGSVDTLDKINTGGVVNVFNAFMADFLNGIDTAEAGVVDSGNYPTLAQKEDAINFLRKYGARPYYEEQPAVRAPIYESFLAYQKFCLKWSEQFKTQFQFTFMPELFPGGIVAFPEHGLQCYVNSVTHNCSYDGGFTTTAELSAPSAYKDQSGKAVDPDKSWVHAGMIRSWPEQGITAKFEGATDEDPAKKDKK